jgi:hypothetical protein
MGVNIWTKKFMLRPVTHCRSGCKGAQRTAQGAGARRMEYSAWRTAQGNEKLRR